ncbi:hypothetical protein JZ751_015677, partial [Albula glossodonta]
RTRWPLDWSSARLEEIGGGGGGQKQVPFPTASRHRTQLCACLHPTSLPSLQRNRRTPSRKRNRKQTLEHVVHRSTPQCK